MSTRRVALVTGGSSGIGRAVAGGLAAAGVKTYATSRRGPVTPATGDGGLLSLQLDVTDDASVERAVSAVLAADGRLDIVVNNAGYGLAGSVEDTSLDEARAQFETNFFGAMRVCRAVLPAMRRQGSGIIVNVSSIGGLIGLPFQAIYSASKFALEGMTEALRQEVAAWGVRVVLVEPGDVRTDITARRVRAAAAANGSAYRAAFESALQVIEAEERAGIDPEEVARVVLRIVEQQKPRVRVRAGKIGQRAAVLAKVALHSRLFERMLMKHYRVG